MSTRQSSLIQILALAVVASCGDNRAARDAPAESVGPSHFELATLPDYNQASETVVAVAGNNVVVLATNQRFPNANSFEYPETDNDPDHPFRRIAYVSSHDRGESFTAPAPLVINGRTDPVVAPAGDGSFWAAATDPAQPPPYRTDLLRSTDAGTTFAQIAVASINDKSWIAVDEVRHAVWIVGYPSFAEIGFDGTARAAFDMTPGPGISAAYSDGVGVHVMSVEGFQTLVWDGVTAPMPEGNALPAGDLANTWTTAPVSMGIALDGGTWILRGLHDGQTGSPIVVRIRHTLDEGRDVTISPPGTVGFLPAGALDDLGRLHAIWYDSSGSTGRLVYTHSETSDLQGAYAPPIIIDEHACPGTGWYPYSSADHPAGGRRLREYIGIAIMRHRAIIAWTHAPDPPSRVWVAHVDF